MFWNTFKSTGFFSAALTILTSLGVHILKLPNEEENWALLIYLSYGNEFSASEVMLGRRGCMRRAKCWTNMHQTWQVLFWPDAFAVNFLNSTQSDLKKASAKHTSSAVLLSSFNTFKLFIQLLKIVSIYLFRKSIACNLLPLYLAYS